MGLVQVRVELPSFTGLPEDEFVNTFNFRWDGPTAPSESELGELLALVVDVYTDDTPTGGILGGYISQEVVRTANACVAKAYTADELGDPFGSPSATLNWTMPTALANAIALPAEVAIVASVYADQVDVPQEVGNTRPAARRRGRIFFGPLNHEACAVLDDPGVQRPSSAVLLTIREAVQRLGEASKDVMNLNAGLFFGVYSPTDLAIRDIISVSTDNAFDTQRRRGPAATSRTTLAVDST